MDSGESTRTRSLLSLLLVASWLREDTALGNEDDVTVREFLLELTGQALLNLVESLDLRNRYKDNDSLLTALYINLTSRGDGEWCELGLEVWDVVAEVD